MSRQFERGIKRSTVRGKVFWHAVIASPLVEWDAGVCHCEGVSPKQSQRLMAEIASLRSQ